MRNLALQSHSVDSRFSGSTLPSLAETGMGTSRVAIYGATDRFNYGDLLFPLVIRWAMAANGDTLEPLNIAVRDSDLSALGGMPTVAMRDVLAEGQLGNCHRLVVAGGQVLDARWTAIVGYLTGAKSNITIRALRKSMGERFTDAVARRVAGVPWPQPFVVPSSGIPKNVELAYNAVGGAEVELLRPAYFNSLRRALTCASYVSVRDTASLEALGRMGIHAELAPDSAAVMSRAFGQRDFDTGCRVSHRQQLSDAGPDYLVFQIGLSYVRDRAREIAATLCATARAQGLKIVLLAIGTASGHEDQLALARIRAHMSDDLLPVSLLDPTIIEVMATIAGARLYIGTSLHGAITAMSFNVPHLAFSSEVLKVTEYLRTWDLEEFSNGLPIEGSPRLVSSALGVGIARRAQLSERLADRAQRCLALAVGKTRP